MDRSICLEYPLFAPEENVETSSQADLPGDLHTDVAVVALKLK